MRYVITILLVLLGPSIACAAYQTATITQVERLPSGETKLTVTFTGDAGESPRERIFFTKPMSTAQAAQNVRVWVGNTFAELNALEAIAALPAIQVGQVIPALAAPAQPAKQIWRKKYFRYLQMLNSDIAAAAAEKAALKADLEATYQVGFLDE